MPELPEVETIRRGLNEYLPQHKIKKVEVSCDKSFLGPRELVKNAKVSSLDRRGKALIINLDNNISLLTHLRMTGQLIFRGKESENFAGGHPNENFTSDLPNRQTRVILELDNGTLFFNDQRKFGFMKVLETAEVGNDPFIRKLAPEPWQISVPELYQKLQKHKNSPVKAVILDQTVIAGIGNIYADEALFFAKVHPARTAGSISEEEAEQIIKGACAAMDASLEAGGSTLKTYVKADGSKGDYLEQFAEVFHREGQPCRRCGTEIVKIRVAGRGTHICPRCQTLEGDTK